MAMHKHERLANIFKEESSPKRNQSPENSNFDLVKA